MGIRTKARFEDLEVGQVFFLGEIALARVVAFPFRSGSSCTACGGGLWNATNFCNNVHICRGTVVEISAYHIKEVD